VAKVKDAMATPVVAVKYSSTLDDALEQMLRRHVSGLPIVDDDGRPVGIISEADIMRLYCEVPDGNVLYDRCETHMTPDPIAIEEKISLIVASEILLVSNVRRLLVVRHGKLVGVLARRDVVRCMRDDQRKRLYVWPDKGKKPATAGEGSAAVAT